MKKWILIFVLVVGFGHSIARAQDSDAAEVSEGDQEEDTPVTHQEIAGEKNLTESRPWRAPDYSHQESSLGWNEKAFDIPKGMETQVQFWIDIYSKYNSDQGVLHDAENIDLVYKVIDFSDITKQADVREGKKDVLKTRLVKQEKKRIIAMLKKLDRLKDGSALEGEEKKIWDYFEKIDEKKKFINATKKNRLRFQLGQKDRIVQGIYFSGRYLEEFEKVFREAGIPMELSRLVFVESSFNVLARSKVGASGLFQLMPYTAKPYMMMNKAIDKRNHPLEAAKVATKLLKINFNMLESWPLAATGWNHGPSGILRLTKKYKTRELVELIDNVTMKRRFGFASRNFYASFLAVLEVERNAPKYLGTVTWSQPLESADLKISKPLKYAEILKWFDGDDMKTQIFNPHINKWARKGKVPIPKGAILSVPKVKYDEVVSNLKR